MDLINLLLQESGHASQKENTNAFSSIRNDQDDADAKIDKSVVKEKEKVEQKQDQEDKKADDSVNNIEKDLPKDDIDNLNEVDLNKFDDVSINLVSVCVSLWPKLICVNSLVSSYDMTGCFV